MKKISVLIFAIVLPAFGAGNTPIHNGVVQDSLTFPSGSTLTLQSGSTVTGFVNSDFPTMAANTIKANATGATATPTDYVTGTGVLTSLSVANNAVGGYWPIPSVNGTSLVTTSSASWTGVAETRFKNSLGGGNVFAVQNTSALGDSAITFWDDNTTGSNTERMAVGHSNSNSGGASNANFIETSNPVGVPGDFLYWLTGDWGSGLQSFKVVEQILGSTGETLLLNPLSASTTLAISGKTTTTSLVINGSQITLGGNLTTSGAFATTLTTTGTTTDTLPTSGTLAALQNANSWTGQQTIATSTLTTPSLIVNPAITNSGPAVLIYSPSASGWTGIGLGDNAGNLKIGWNYDVANVKTTFNTSVPIFWRDSGNGSVPMQMNVSDDTIQFNNLTASTGLGLDSSKKIISLPSGTDSNTLFVQTNSTGPSATTSETAVTGTGVGSLTIPANRLVAGSNIHYHWSGYLATSVTPTLEVKAKLGSTVISDTGAQTLVAITGNGLCTVEGDITCRTTGASGTVIGQGMVVYYSGATGLNGIQSTPSTATTTIDTTATQAFSITFQFGAATGNSATFTNGILTVQN